MSDDEGRVVIITVDGPRPPKKPRKIKPEKPLNIEQHYIYQHPEYNDLANCYNAFSFLKAPLTPGSVVFWLPSKKFSHRAEAYDLIKKEIGPVVGDMFIPISEEYPTTTNDLLINTKFCNEEDTEKAVSTGVTVEGVKYTAVRYIDVRRCNNTIVIKLTFIPLDTSDVIADKLKESLSKYGKIMLIKRLSYNGLFEGDIEITLECDGSGLSRSSLPKRLYLEAWNIHVPATYLIFRQVCTCCFEEDHVVEDCKNK